MQWIIGGNGAGSKNGATYVSKTKEILKEMYLEQKNEPGESITDEDGNQWAKKEDFSEKDGEVILDWPAIQKVARAISGGRSGYTSPANEGYTKNEKDRRPAPPEYPSPSNHLSGEAMDINRHKFFNYSDALIDAIGLNFGVIRAGGPSEWWHFELTDLKMSGNEEAIMDDKTYPNQEV